jgi:hypothetical protein
MWGLLPMAVLPLSSLAVLPVMRLAGCFALTMCS